LEALSNIAENKIFNENINNEFNENINKSDEIDQSNCNEHIKDNNLIKKNKQRISILTKNENQCNNRIRPYSAKPALID